jgi:tetratricopeptide (TPR) repeat protein
MTRCFPVCFTIALVVIALVVGACSQDPNVKKQQYLEQGIKYQAEGKFNEAVIQLKNALQIDPKFAPALHALGRAYRAKAWTLDALRELQRAVELEPTNVAARADLAQTYLDLEAWTAALEQANALGETDPGGAAALYVRGAALHGQGDSGQAVQLLSKALLLGTPSAELQKAYGDSLATLGRRADAEQAYRAALAKQPKYSEALIGLANLLWRQGKRDVALDVLNQAKAVEPHGPKVALAFSELHTAEGQLGEAVKDLEGLPRQAWSPRVLLALSTLYLRTGQFEKAHLTLRPLAQMMPDAPIVRYLQAHAALGLNRVDDAIRDLQAVAARLPDNAFARYALGNAYLAGGRARDALREFDAVAKSMEGVVDYHLQVARAQLHLGEFDRALKAARVASGLKPQRPQPWGILGTIYAARGDLKRAESMYAKALEVDPSFSPGRVALGNVYNLEKKPEEALKEYESALQANPDYAPALRAKIATLVQQGRTDDAFTLVQATLKRDPQNAELITTRAFLHDRKGDRKAAEADLKHAIQVDEKYVPARFALARLLLADKRESEAIAQLQRVLTDRPGEITATLTLAYLHTVQARYDQAIAILEPAVKATPTARELTLALSDLYIRRARFDEAVSLLAPMVSADSTFVPPRLLLGLAYLGKYNTAEAISQFEQVNQINPTMATSHYYRARALLSKGDLDGAQKAYRKALELEPDSKAIRIELAALSGRRPDDELLASQIEDLKGALERDPGNIAIRNALARAYLIRKQRKEAEAEYKRILDVVPTFVPANLALGMLRYGDGRWDEAADYLKAVIRVEPQNLQANLLLSEYFRGKGNLEAQIHHLEVVNRVSPPDAELKLRLAHAYAQSGRVDQGLLLAKEAASQPRVAAAAYLVVGQLELQRGALPQAAEALNTAIKLQPNLAPAYFVRATVYERAGETNKAIGAYRKALTLNPKDPAVLNNLAWIYASREENLDEAIALALRAQDLAPNSASILDTLGFVYYRRKEYAKAELALKKAAELDATLAAVHYHLGMTFYRLGKKEEAIASLKRSLQLDEKSPDVAEARRLLLELGSS